MIKSKGKYLKLAVITLLNIIVLSPIKVAAANAVGTLGSGSKPGIHYNHHSDLNYIDYSFTVNFNGGSYEGYCLDPGYSFSGSIALNCRPLGEEPEWDWLMNNLTGNHAVDQLAIRFLAIRTNKNQSASSHGLDIVSYLQNRLGHGGLSGYGLTAINNNGQYVLDEAFKLSETALSHSNDVPSNSSNDLSVEKSNETDAGNYVDITYIVKSSIENLDFKCDDGSCSIVEKNITNGSGTVKIRVANKKCSYTLNVYGDSSSIYVCEGEGSVQNLITKIAIEGMQYTETTSGILLKTIKGSISSDGSYYKQYCDNDKCKEKTEVEIPNYCDDAGDKQITITAPKDVKYCILNNSDEAGNTYQMVNDGQISNDNPYCAIYCKEDYTMTMPGAQYTTSGRYFTLQNTVVEATRTCYATNPNGNPEEPQILIDEFVAEVNALQKQMIDAFNEYQFWNAVLKSANNALETKNSATCINKQTGLPDKQQVISASVFRGSDVTYKIFDFKLENARTGKWQYQATRTGTAKYIYGEQASCNGNIPIRGGDNGELDKSGVAAKVEEYKGLVNELREELKQKIEYMEECYKWENRLCMNPEVIFDYDEQYGINYELVSGGGDFPSSDATYSTNKNLLNNNKEYLANDSGTLNTYNYAFCDVDADTCNNNFEQAIANNISTLEEKLYYRKIVANGRAEYTNTQQFESNYPHGTIDAAPAGSSEPRYNYEYLGAVFPVALNTPKGVYQWTLNFSDLGQYNDFAGCKNGRLDDVVKAIGASTSAGVEYVCVYVVDCPDCDFECVGDGCFIDDCPECDVYCENCIFDGEDTYFYRLVSLNDMNPNDRTPGPNWTNEKAIETLQAIDNGGNPEEAYKEAQYTFVLTPSNMKEIRDYNKETGTYVAQDLEYHDLNGVTNAYGTSAFLRNQKTQRRFFSQVKLNDSWTLWEAATGLSNTVVDVNSSVGPAWK